MGVFKTKSGYYTYLDPYDYIEANDYKFEQKVANDYDLKKEEVKSQEEINELKSKIKKRLDIDESDVTVNGVRRKKDFKGILHNREDISKIDDGRWCANSEIVTLKGYGTCHIEDVHVVKDIENGEFYHKKECIKVVAEIESVDTGLKLTYGWFHTNSRRKKDRNLISFIYKGERLYVLDIDLLRNNKDIVEDFKGGQFLYKDDFKKYASPVFSDYEEFDNIVSKSDDQKENYKYGTDSPTYITTEGDRSTFGVEIETVAGTLPSYARQDLNFKAVRDGSLKDEDGRVHGAEYVSGVLKGDMGFNQVQKLCVEISKRCAIDHRAGLHVHIGVQPSQNFVVSLYKLCLAIENDLFRMLPASRQKSEHCKKLNKFKFDFTNITDQNDYKMRIDQYYTDLHKHYAVKSAGPDFKQNKNTTHPLGTDGKCHYDKTTPRYCWLNLVPTFFSRVSENQVKTNSHTVEFRQHSGTMNFIKVRNWIKICMAIVRYAENNQKDIIYNDKINLKDVIMSAYPKRGNKLWDYYEQRVMLFNSSSISKGDSESREYNPEIQDMKTIKELITT